jgi:hypothetical protein
MESQLLGVSSGQPQLFADKEIESQLRGVSSGQPQLFAEIARSHEHTYYSRNGSIRKVVEIIYIFNPKTEKQFLVS